jgi:hypothetical protein
MRWWMVPWLLPLGILGAVVAVAMFNTNAGVLMLSGAVLLVLLGWSLFSSAGEDPDADVNYWRLSDWRRFR